MDSLINALPAKRDQVFIKYSRDDRNGSSIARHASAVHVEPLVESVGRYKRFPRRRLEYRDQETLAAAKVAVLLVTPQYLARVYQRGGTAEFVGPRGKRAWS